MSSKVKRIPDGFHTITAHLVVRDAPAAIEFYKRAFGAAELRREFGPDGQTIMYCEMKLGDSIFYVTEESPEMGQHSPLALRGSPISLHLYVEDADALFARAIKAGASEVVPMNDAFWGDRFGAVADPFGHQWAIAHRQEELTPAEIRRRAMQAFGGESQQNPASQV